MSDAVRSKQVLAIAGAQQAALGAAELARFAHEGEAITGQALDEDTLEKLADALKLAIEVNGDLTGDVGQLYGAVVRFLDGWAG